MLTFLLAKTVTFPMNVLLPLLVAWALVMVIRETVISHRSWRVFWCYIFMILAFLLIGWPPKFMQDAVLLPEATATTLP